MNPEESAQFKECFEQFKEPTEDELGGSDVSEIVRPHPVKFVDQYFALVAQTGKPCIEWEVVRPVFIWKVKHVMNEMVRLDIIYCAEFNERIENTELKRENGVQGYKKDTSEAGRKIKRFVKKEKADLQDPSGELRQLYDGILSLLDQLDGFPFTFQRLCELLSEPNKQYTRAEKFFRALDKCINVVSTITADGKRITGLLNEFVPSNHSVKIEQRFFGKVDEFDDGPWTNPNASSRQLQDKPLDMSKKENNPAVINDILKLIKPIDQELLLIPGDVEREGLAKAEEFRKSKESTSSYLQDMENIEQAFLRSLEEDAQPRKDKSELEQLMEE